ncbi:MAG: DinB family protein [Acidobacteriota bacterium]
MTTRGGLQAASEEYFEQYMEKIRHCVSLLSEDEVWRRPAKGANSIANLLLHLTGNLSLWVLNSLGGEHNERHRSLEFSSERAQIQASKDELTERLAEVVERCRKVARSLSEEDLERSHDIQSYATDGFGALFHALEHMSYHTGQIVYWAKVLTEGRETIEFYPQHHSE